MSIFKKPEKGFLAKLFKHKQVEELAEELAHTYADEMQEELQPESGEPTTAEDTATEPVPMLEVMESGEVDFTEPPETTEGESPPQDTEPSEVRKHILTFRVNDEELEALNRRYAETSFRSRGDFCRYSALTVMNVEKDTEDIKQIARRIESYKYQMSHSPKAKIIRTTAERFQQSQGLQNWADRENMKV